MGIRTADSLIPQHGAETLNEVKRLITAAIHSREADRALLMFRVPAGRRDASGSAERAATLA